MKLSLSAQSHFPLLSLHRKESAQHPLFELIGCWQLCLMIVKNYCCCWKLLGWHQTFIEQGLWFNKKEHSNIFQIQGKKPVWQAAGRGFFGTVHLDLNFTQVLLCGLRFWTHSNPPATMLAFAVRTAHQIDPNQMLTQSQSKNCTTCTMQADIFIWFRSCVPRTEPSEWWRRSEL